MKFDPRTIEHLGIQMYSTLPPVLAELVSNAYDAEANNVKIHLFDDGEKKIIVEDDGHGMSFQEINSKFLLIGRNRRVAGESQKSENGKRFVIGKKGLGKLAFFGIAEHIRVETIKNFKRSIFEMDWGKIRQIIEPNNPYSPDLIVKEEKCDIEQGTKFILTQIKRKSEFSPEHLARSLAKSFQIFDEADFNVKIYHNSEVENIVVKNELKYTNINIAFEWNLPKDKALVTKDYLFADLITGKIISAKDTVSSDMRGVALFSRGKLVNNYNFLDVKSTSHGYSYITGWLNVDFIEEFERDVISTNRQSLNWELEETSELKLYLESVYRAFFNAQKEEKKLQKVKEVKKVTGIELELWLSGLPKHEAILARKISDSILNAEGINIEKAGELIKYTKDSFQFEAFKELVAELESVDIENSSVLLSIFREWEIIETKEMAKLATGRIQTIKTFERLIDENALEVKEIHPFFEKFPWILDPRINMFRHEVQYVKLLKENYKEEDLEEKNRRIDFLCTSVSNHRFVIEIKRPNHRITRKDIDQAKDYRSFIEERCENSPQSPSRVVAYIVGGYIGSDDRLTRDEVESMRQTDKVYVKTFSQLLTDAQNYHKEFLEKYEKLTEQNVRQVALQ
ncbi:histidine kinase/DNA gyrase B/HSP90-like ATPase [Prolixibacter denitrificans]|nr:histidine kinase/DNA gyrase B/HSP90-like ATPase [Prolixibacter denitrificans]